MSKLDELLDLVDYRDDPNYVPSDFALQFINFIKLVNAENGGEENKSPVFHYKILDTYAAKHSRVININHRGAGKSTLMEYLILMTAVYGEIPGWGEQTFWLYVSDSIENGIKSMRRSLENRWENSKFLQKYIPKLKFTDQRWEFTNITGKKFVVRGFGVNTGVRGAREFNTRPSWALLDDLLDDEGSKSPTVINNIKEIIYKAITYALHPENNRIIWSGTPFNSKDPLFTAVNSNEWVVNCFPICEQFPVDKKDFRGSWEDRFNYEYVSQEYNIAVGSGNPGSFYRELMLRIISGEERVISEDDIYYYDKQELINNKEQYKFYITTDFATSEKSSSDFSVISVWALGRDNKFYWVDGIIRRQLMNQNINDLFKLVKTYKPSSVGIEISGQQGGFISWLMDEMRRRNTYFPLAKTGKSFGIRPTTSKIERFNVVEPWFKLGRILFPNGIEETKIGKEIMNELSLITTEGFKSAHDDFIDTVSMLALIKAIPPSEGENRRSDKAFQPAHSNIWGTIPIDEGVSEDYYTV